MSATHALETPLAGSYEKDSTYGDNLTESVKMERLNGEVRDREQNFRGLKTDDSPILKGYQLYHNFIRPHEGLDGKTPAEACGIKVEGANKWQTIIENASKPTIGVSNRNGSHQNV